MTRKTFQQKWKLLSTTPIVLALLRLCCIETESEDMCWHLFHLKKEMSLLSPKKLLLKLVIELCSRTFRLELRSIMLKCIPEVEPSLEGLRVTRCKFLPILMG